MTTHLADAMLVELAEQGSPHPHLAQCERCRAQVTHLRALLEDARDLDVPEPSPLFWEHFSARLADGVRAEERRSATTSRWSWGRVSWRLALVAASLVVVALATWHTAVIDPIRPRPSLAGPASVAARSAALATADTAEDDEAWSLVTGAAADLDLDQATSAGFELQPGTAEMAAAQLTPDEQRELVRLLQAAVAQPGL